MNIKKEYIAPTLELLSYRAEVGFAGSLLVSSSALNHEPWNSDYDNGMERWGWNGDNTDKLGNSDDNNNWTW